MECKVRSHLLNDLCSFFDLIDTLWNVKEHPTHWLKEFLDLIDTLWNVKSETPSAQGGLRSRFNRYIVECKGRSMQDSTRPRIRI